MDADKVRLDLDINKLEEEIARLRGHITGLEAELKAAGAVQDPLGSWRWPYYTLKNKRLQTEFMNVEEWKDRRASAAAAVESCMRLLRDI